MMVGFYNSPVGCLRIETNNDAVVGLQFCEKPTANDYLPNPVFEQCCRELDEYFKGERIQFEVPLEVKGTAFQEEVWQALRKIGYSQTISYAELAQNVNHPKAHRAAGSANGKNPIAIIIPCHRVIASNGTLGGYAYGLEVKKKLLDLEKKNRNIE